MARSPLFPRWNGRNNDQNQQGQPATQRSGSSQGAGLRSWLKKAVTNKVMKELGDAASLIYSLIRPKGKSLTEDVEKEIEAATDLLANIQSGGPTQKPPTRPMIVSDRFADDDGRSYPPNNPPLIEGPILVESSNVFSIAWEHSLNGNLSGNLLVRFLAGDSKNRSGPGACYRYFGLRYEDFQSFRLAASKGGWVWDHLRIRGSVVGHQVNFEIVDVGELDRVPRAVANKRGESGQFYVPRTLGGVRSTLPERKIGRSPRTSLAGWDRRSNLQLRPGR